MIELLGKRPFANRKDEMDKWLDENSGKSAPPPLEPAADIPEPTAAVKRVGEDLRS
jgi:AFG3 family protein